MTKNSNKKGFTLLEILVIITIIGILATVALVFYGDMRQRSRITEAKHDLDQIRSAISVMSIDTNKWPGKLTIGEIGNGELDLNENKAGLINTDGTFENWGGPYIKSDLIDPWGNPYFFDTDYDLPVGGGQNGSDGAVIGSYGPDGKSFKSQCAKKDDFKHSQLGSGSPYCDEDNVLIILVGPN